MGGRTIVARKAFECALQVVVVTKLRKNRRVERLHGERLIKTCDGTGQIAVGLHSDQFARGGQPIKCLAQVLAHHARNTICSSNNGIQRAMLRKPLSGSFRAHLLDTRNIVHRIAHQGEVIDNAVRRHSKLLLHPRKIKHAGRPAIATHGVHQNDMVVHELGKVFVAGGDHGCHALRSGLAGKRSNDIVSLNAIDNQHGPAQRLHRLKNNWHLGREVFGHGRACCLVVGINSVAKGGALRVKNAGGVLRRPFVLHTSQHIDHARNSASGMPRTASKIGQGVKGPVQEA